MKVIASQPGVTLVEVADSDPAVVGKFCGGPLSWDFDSESWPNGHRYVDGAIAAGIRQLNLGV